MVLAVAVSGMAIAQDVVKDGKEKRGGLIKEDPTIRAQGKKFGTSKKGIKTPSGEIQPVRILGFDSLKTDDVVVTGTRYDPPPITVGGSAGSGYFGYGNTSDPGSYGGGGASGTGETPPADDDIIVRETCKCNIRSEVWDGGYTLTECPDQKEPHTTIVTWDLVYNVEKRVAKTSPPSSHPSPLDLCLRADYTTWTATVILVPKDGCTGTLKDAIVYQAIGNGTPDGGFRCLINKITPCRGNPYKP